MKRTLFSSAALSLLFLPLLALYSFADISDGSANMVLGKPDLVHNNPNSVTDSAFDSATSIHIDRTSGKAYVADSGNNRVLWWDSIAGLADGQAANGVLGQADLTSNLPNRGGSADASTLYNPYDIEVDASGNVWVADRGNNRLLRYDSPISNGMSASIVLGQLNFTDTAAACTRNLISRPSAIKLDASENLWVTLYGNNRALRFNAPFTNGMNAIKVLGQADYTSGDANRGGAVADNTLFHPESIGLDSTGNIWIADSDNNRVLRFNTPLTNGMSADRVLGQADFISNSPNQGGSIANNTLDYPAGISFDSTGNIWVADKNNNRILEYLKPLNSSKAAKIVLGQTNFIKGEANRGGSVASNTLSAPFSIDFDSSDNLWAADKANNRVVKYPAPIASGMAADLVLGKPDFLHKHPNSVTGSAFDRGTSIHIDRTSGKAYVADSGNNRVLWWDSITGLVDGQAADGVLGQADLTSNLPNRGGSADESTLSNPYDIEVDASGNVWVADRGNNRLLRYDSPISNGMSASIVLGQLNFTDTAAACTRNLISRPSAIKLDASENLWVTLYGNNRALRFNAPFTNGMNAIKVLGQADYTSGDANRGGAVADNTLFHPESIGLDSTGNIWIADSDNNRVLRFNTPLTNGMSADRVLGQADFISNSPNQGGSIANNTLDYPAGISFDSTGNIWVADKNNNRILEYLKPLNSSKAAKIVLGQTNFIKGEANRGGSVASNTLSAPFSIDFDTSDNLWAADKANNRVLKYDGIPPPPLAITSITPSQGSNTGSVSITDLAGTSFEDGFIVTLQKAGETDFSATNVSVISSNKITCDLDLTGKTVGDWDVYVASASGTPNATLAGGFTITTPLTITSITPSQGSNTGSVSITDLAGTSFEDGFIVTLTKAGETDITATNISVVSQNKITCDLDLTGKTVGDWDVYVASASGTPNATLAGGFTITTTANKNESETVINKGDSATITISPNSGNITADFPSGCFDQTVTVTLSTDTIPASEQSGLKTTLIGIKIDTDLGLQPNKPIIITLYYTTADLNGTDEKNLVLARYDENTKRWIPLPTTVYPKEKKVVATIDHLSRFGILARTSSTNLEGVNIFPNPFNPGLHSQLTIENLTDTADIKIFTISRELVKELDYSTGNGVAFWDGKNGSGMDVARGIYLFYIKSPNGVKKMKVAVEQ